MLNLILFTTLGAMLALPFLGAARTWYLRRQAQATLEEVSHRAMEEALAVLRRVRESRAHLDALVGEGRAPFVVGAYGFHVRPAHPQAEVLFSPVLDAEGRTVALLETVPAASREGAVVGSYILTAGPRGASAVVCRVDDRGEVVRRALPPVEAVRVLLGHLPVWRLTGAPEVEA